MRIALAILLMIGLHADPKSHGLFIAAIGNDTAEAIDVEGRRHGTLQGQKEPQARLP